MSDAGGTVRSDPQHASAPTLRSSIEASSLTPSTRFTLDDATVQSTTAHRPALNTSSFSQGSATSVPLHNSGNDTSEDCQPLLVSWSLLTSSLYKDMLTLTTTWARKQITVTVEHGPLDVYTTIDGFAHARGSRNITSTSLYTYSESSVYLVRTTTKEGPHNISLPPRPTCTIDYSSCATLYSTYRQHLGLDVTEHVPWTDLDSPNSPRCIQTDAVATCISRANPKSLSTCVVSGNKVDLYYWPVETGRAKESALLADEGITAPPSTAPRTFVTKGITMTSPSVYLSFDTLHAAGAGGVWIDCLTETSLLSFWNIDHGATRYGQWFSAPVHSLSTLEKIIDPTLLFPSYPNPWQTISPFGSGGKSAEPQTFPDAAIEAMRRPNGSEYSFWAQVLYSANAGVTPVALDLQQLTRPSPRAYYLRPSGLAPVPYPYGCNPQGPNDGCNIIMDDAYRAIVSLPAMINQPDPAWAGCNPGYFGALDPPIALPTVDYADMPAPVTSSSMQSISISASPSPALTQAIATSTTTFAPIPTSIVDVRIIASVQTSMSNSPEAIGPTESAGVDRPASFQTAARNPMAGSLDPVAVFQGSQPSAQTFFFATLPTTPISTLQAQHSHIAETATDTEMLSASIHVNDPAQMLTGVTKTTSLMAQASRALNVLANMLGSHHESSLVPASAIATAHITMDGKSFVASSSGNHIVVGGATLSSGQALTLNGMLFSNAPEGMVVRPASTTAAVTVLTGTAAITDHASVPIDITIGTMVFTRVSAGGYALDNQTLFLGGPAVTTDGTMYTLTSSPSGLAISTRTSLLQGPHDATGTVVASWTGSASTESTTAMTAQSSTISQNALKQTASGACRVRAHWLVSLIVGAHALTL
ncbi:hypothetical protein AMS68_006965 [Peltaster fructicola]|uniref:Uncharacterized protein n=1 Tax=Peltaster fructicola TaxID=286661 RepID=A0A6H0Y3M3_9PEZI|nr:hypothetical protein AMS68_006965 [Peltaster fructicola]